MSIEGRLSLRIGWDGRRVGSTRIQSTRPAGASQVLENRSARDACALVPRLYGVCGEAQAAAAALACDFAQGTEASTETTRWRERRLTAECTQECLWRLLLDLPPLLGEAAKPREFSALRQRLGRVQAEGADRSLQPGAWLDLAEELEMFVAGNMLGMSIDDWEACGLDVWLTKGATGTARMIARLIAETAGADEVASLPWLAADALKADIAPALAASDEFARLPTWRGEAAETGAWPRQRAHARLREASHQGLAARVLARLIEVAGFPARLRALASEGVYRPWLRGAQVAPGTGISAAETARGTLVHCVALDGEQVVRWRSIAPTEWNFHPAGAFARGLAGIEARNEAELRRAATLLACILDPCVEFDIAVDHA